MSGSGGQASKEHRYSGEPPPGRFNMARYAIGRAAARNPDRIALEVWEDAAADEPAEAWTYGALQAAVLRVAGGLAAAGLKRGERLVIRMENTSACALMYFGAIAGGFVPVPSSRHLTGEEAAFLLADSEATAVAVDDSLALAELSAEALPGGTLHLGSQDIAALIEGDGSRGAPPSDYADTAADDPAFLIYTSGTTARPKGVLHAQRSAWGRRPMYDGWYGIGSDDTMLHAGDLNWTYTLGTGLCDPWANGAKAVVLTGAKDAVPWPRLIAASGATMFAAVPGVFRQILKRCSIDPVQLARLRHGLTAGEAPPGGLFEAWEAATGTPLYEALGMSEISTYVSSGPLVPRRPGTVGRPQPGRSVAILPIEGGGEPLPPGQEGLIGVHRSDPGLMIGYWRRPDEEREVFRGPWFVGGDIGMIDADGYLTHLGRANDIMKALGYRVSPQEVEAVLSRHPAVAEVACAEVRVRDDLSLIGAFIVARGDDARPAVEDLEAYAAEHLAPYKRPRIYKLVDALPRTANGKIQRSRLTPAGGE